MIVQPFVIQSPESVKFQLKTGSIAGLFSNHLFPYSGRYAPVPIHNSKTPPTPPPRIPRVQGNPSKLFKSLQPTLRFEQLHHNCHPQAAVTTMAAPSAPAPPVLSDPAPASSSRSGSGLLAAASRASLLDHHSSQLQQRSAALDLRAHELAQAEARLSQRSSALQTRTHALSRLETAARAEMVSLLEGVTARHEKLTGGEKRLSSRETHLKKKVAALRGLLRDGAKVEKGLREKRGELAEIEGRKDEVVDALREAEERLKRVENVAAEADGRARKVAQEGDVLRRAAERLEELEREVQKREKELGAKEKDISEGEDRVRRLTECEAVVEPLRRFVAEYVALVAESEGRQSLDTSEGAGEDASPEIVAADALAAVRELSVLVRSLHAQKSGAEAKEAQLEDRDRRARKAEVALRARERGVEAAEGRLGVTRESLRAVQSDVDKAWRGIEEARTELDNREENLRGKEAEMLQAEQKVRRKEKGMLQAEKMLVRRERSIRRAHAAVAEREKAVEQRQRDIDEEKASLQSLKTTIDLKEDLLDTRELELTTREAKKNKALEALLEASVEKRKRRSARERSMTPESGTGVSGTPGTDVSNPAVNPPGETGNQATNSHTGAEESGERVPAVAGTSQGQNPAETQEPAEPSTVRRQLAFESTVQRDGGTVHKEGSPMTINTEMVNANASTKPSYQQGRTKNNTEGNDDESETAADDLLPELIGARALWKERIMRLEAVVENMRENTWALKPHVQPVLTSVSARLQDIRSEIDSAPEKQFESSKMSYGTEQRRQVRWGALMREQLDAVRDVQAGMLIALNKEEDAMISAAGLDPALMEPSETETTTTPDVSERSHENVSPTVGGEDESSVDVTLDATAAGLFPDHSLEVTEDFGMITSSFQKFRRQMRAQRGIRQNARNSRIIGRDRLRQGSARIQAGQPTTSSALIRDTPGNRGNELLQELASLRNELENITGSSHSS